MPHAKNRWTVKRLMIVIALSSVILCAWMRIARWVDWMEKAGY